jgi:RecB family exonuclease
MSTARAFRLVRVPTLRAAHRALAALSAGLDPAAARGTAVLVPTAAAAAQLRRTLEHRILGTVPAPDQDFAQLSLPAPPRPCPPVVCWPDILTRAGWYARLFARLPGAPRLLDEFEREALMRAAARAAIQRGARPPFAVRPGTVAEMLRFHDSLRRLNRTTGDAERLLTATLGGGADEDRGAARLLEQTRFLVASFRLFEERCDALDALDEHGVRARALGSGVAGPFTHLVVTVGDIAAEPAGLWPADFDLLARGPGLARVDVVLTEQLLATGLYERLEERLPGIREVRFDTFDPSPSIVVPGSPDGPLYAIARDREEELAAVARTVKWDAAHTAPGEPTAPDDQAVVVQRPLPYLYLARHTLDAAGVPWTAADALPLAAEPYAAAVDLVCHLVIGDFTRGALTELLRSAQFRFRTSEGPAIGPVEVSRLDEMLSRAGHFGGIERLRDLLGTRVQDGRAAAPASPAAALGRACAVALDVIDALSGLSAVRSIAEHARGVLAFLDRYEAGPPEGEPQWERHRRARAAIRGALLRLAEAAVAHDDVEVSLREVVATLRRWIEARTFEPRVGVAGVHLLDATAARYAGVEVAWLLGLVEGEWPESGQRDIFYPASLLADLGWPRDSDRTAAGRAAFADLLRLPGRRVTVSTFTLEDEAIVQPAVVLEELETCGLPVVRPPGTRAGRVFADEAIAFDPIVAAAGVPGDWLAMRRRRPDRSGSRFHGDVGAFHRRDHAVTHVDTYLDCPFRYFAERVLRLEDEREPEPGLAPRERGEIAHEIFRRFFEEWQAAGRGAVTPDSLDEARASFARVVEAVLAAVDPADAAVERARLLGSALAPAFGDRVLQLEVERDEEVYERRLEENLDGTYTFAGEEGSEHLVAIRGKADRIDLLAGGLLDLVDYKTGRAPGARSVQLPIYALAAEQRLRGYRDSEWRARAADYVALRGNAVTHALGRDGQAREERLDRAQREFVSAVRDIGAGRFPPRPAELRLCTWCPYGGVCRKDYVGDVDA